MAVLCSRTGLKAKSRVHSVGLNRKFMLKYMDVLIMLCD